MFQYFEIYHNFRMSSFVYKIPFLQSVGFRGHAFNSFWKHRNNGHGDAQQFPFNSI